MVSTHLWREGIMEKEKMYQELPKAWCEICEQYTPHEKYQGLEICTQHETWDLEEYYKQ